MCFHITWTAAGVFSDDLFFAKKCIHFKEDVVVSETLFKKEKKKEKRIKCKQQIKETHTIL